MNIAELQNIPQIHVYESADGTIRVIIAFFKEQKQLALETAQLTFDYFLKLDAPFACELQVGYFKVIEHPLAPILALPIIQTIAQTNGRTSGEKILVTILKGLIKELKEKQRRKKGDSK